MARLMTFASTVTLAPLLKLLGITTKANQSDIGNLTNVLVRLLTTQAEEEILAPLLPELLLILL